MNERERLIELLKSCSHYICEQDDLIERIADHLLANGVIVPPCKVGDTVYAYCEVFGVVLPYFVENLRIGFLDKGREYWVYEANCQVEETHELLDEMDFDLDDLGKTVFLTREDAEKALKGGANNDE